MRFIADLYGIPKALALFSTPLICAVAMGAFRLTCELSVESQVLRSRRVSYAIRITPRSSPAYSLPGSPAHLANAS